jgi:hypothetical protein
MMNNLMNNIDAYLVLPPPHHSFSISVDSSFSMMKFSSLKETERKIKTPVSPITAFFPLKPNRESQEMESIGLDVGCGCGRSTFQRVKDYPKMPWIGVDKMLDRFEQSYDNDYIDEKKVMFWHEDMLALPRQKTFQQMIQQKHVYLSFTNVLHEFWQDEERRDDWFLMLNEIQTYASSCTLLFEDHYAEYPPSMISFFLESNRFPHTMNQEPKKSLNPLSSFVCRLHKS